MVYGGRTLTDRVNVVVDMDDPTVQITSPANGAVLRGTSFVVGGIANDPTSWVSGVAVQVNTGAYQAAVDGGNLALNAGGNHIWPVD